MEILQRVADWLAPQRQLIRAEADAAAHGFESHVLPPARDAAPRYVDPSAAATMSEVYRAIDLIAGSVAQLSVDSYRHGFPLETSDTPTLIKKPDIMLLDRAEWLEQVALCLTMYGEAFIIKQHNAHGDVINLPIAHPAEMSVQQDAQSRIIYHQAGTRLNRNHVIHLKRFALPGQLRGLGPIQAARADLGGALDQRDYAAEWFDTTGEPTGVLQSDQALSPDDALRMRNRWNGLDDDGDRLDQTTNPTGVRVLSKGTRYVSLHISPKDAQWLESRQFNTLQIARLFGIPADLLLVSPEGSSQTYSNIEQDQIKFYRHTLRPYLTKIEAALTSVIAHGQRARFNLDGFLAPDTKARYEAHKIGIDAGFLTVDEVRAIEGRRPLTTIAETTGSRTNA